MTKKKTCNVPRYRFTTSGRTFYTYGKDPDVAYGNALKAGHQPDSVDRDGEYDRGRNVISGASDLADEVVETWPDSRKR